MGWRASAGTGPGRLPPPASHQPHAAPRSRSTPAGSCRNPEQAMAPVAALFRQAGEMILGQTTRRLERVLSPGRPE